VVASGKHSESNHYRIAFGATAFPFKDPSPNTNDNLLGVRLDVCARNGQFAKPYYVLLRQERVRGSNGKRLRVHRHTVPAFISMSKLESVFLSFPGPWKARADDDVEEENLKPWKEQTRKQDLRGFVRELRRELVAWHMRSDAVEFLREKLGLRDAVSGERASPVEGTGVVSLTSTAVEARYVRLEWEDGRVGRFKLSNAGLVERAVVIGDAGRDKRTEDAMTGGGGRVEALLDRLRELGSPTA
jgi:central kinetochore subunit Mal2/MCM21